MSSSNRVRIAFIEESTYGSTPGAGNFSTARFISESLSGTPETTESAQIRTDRMSSGQVVTGLTVGGDVNFEMAKETALESFFKSAMYSSWSTGANTTVDLTLDATAKTITRASGDWATDVEVGDIITLAGFVSAFDNVTISVTSLDSATVISYAGRSTMVDEVGSGTSYVVGDRINIGTTKTSFSMIKEFTDLTTKAINYRGKIVSGFNLAVNYGEIVNGTFNFSGNDYEAVDAAGDFMTDSRTIDDAATTSSMNGSVDMPFIISDVDGTLEALGFCIQGVEISLNNNLTPQNCIGLAAPKNYSEGTAQINVTMNTYLADGNWSMLAKKLAQTPFSLGWVIENADGYYGFYLPQIQVSFDDPASAGQNQDVFLNMTGVAKIGQSGESALKIMKG